MTSARAGRGVGSRRQGRQRYDLTTLPVALRELRNLIEVAAAVAADD